MVWRWVAIAGVCECYTGGTGISRVTVSGPGCAKQKLMGSTMDGSWNSSVLNFIYVFFFCLSLT